MFISLNIPITTIAKKKFNVLKYAIINAKFIGEGFFLCVYIYIYIYIYLFIYLFIYVLFYFYFIFYNDKDYVWIQDTLHPTALFQMYLVCPKLKIGKYLLKYGFFFTIPSSSCRIYILFYFLNFSFSFFSLWQL
jgi:hypothetical protein